MIDFQDLSILSWNIRGDMNISGRRHVRELLRKFKTNLVFLVETHCVFKKAENFCKNIGYERVAISKAHGQAGGICVLLEKASIF